MVSERKVRVTVTERTIHSKVFDLAELEEVAGYTLADVDDDLDAFIDAVVDGVPDVEGWREDLQQEENVDVDDESWQGEWVDPTPDEVGYRTRDGIAAAVYAEEERDE